MNDTYHNSEPKFVDSFGCSKIGRDRETNADQFVVAELKRAARVHHASRPNLDDSRHFGANQAHVLVVADGVSDEVGAKIASSLVVDEVLESVLNGLPWTRELDVDSEANLRSALKKTVVRCNEQVSNATNTLPSSTDIASTLTMAFVRWPHAFVVHAGDSRAYLVRKNQIEQLTTDHTFAQQMVEDGSLSEEQAETSRFANMLWNAVGGDSRVEPELTVKTLQPGDSLLLCTDGLTSYLNDDAIQHLVSTERSSEAACSELVNMVTAIGGDDDVTVAMARFEDEIEAKVAADQAPRPIARGRARRQPKHRTMPSVTSADALQAQASA